MFSERDVFWMQHAYQLALRARECNEVPVGAVLILNDQLVGEGFNSPIKTNDSTAHAEMNAIRNAGQCLNNYRLTHTKLYVTLEPCLMCVGAMVHARIGELIFGAYDPKSGAVLSQTHAFDQQFLNHQVQYKGGLMKDACGEILSQFFIERRLQQVGWEVFCTNYNDP